jgi:hypothetical protein
MAPSEKQRRRRSRLHGLAAKRNMSTLSFVQGSIGEQRTFKTITATKGSVQDLSHEATTQNPHRSHPLLQNSCHSTVCLYFLNDLDNILILKLMLLHTCNMNQCRSETEHLAQCRKMLIECIPCQLSVAYVSRWNPIPERCKVLCHES